MKELVQAVFNKTTPEIHGYQGRIYHYGKENVPIHLDEHTWQFKSKESVQEIPVVSIWNYKNHDKIAETIAKGGRIAMYMWGTYGTGYLLNFPEWQNKDSNEARDLRENLKIGRPKDQSFTTLIYPDDEWMFWDFDQLHDSLQYLENAEKRARLRTSGPVHIIVPRKEIIPYLDESLQWPHDNTFSDYYMPHPGWERVIKKLRKIVKHAVFAGGSLNMHKKDPVYRTKDLYKRIAEIPEWAETVDLIVVCEITESQRVFRSQLMVRLAQKGSDGVSEKVREGSTLAGRWGREHNIPLKDAREGVKEASSYWPYTSAWNYWVDTRVQLSKLLMEKFDREDAKKLLKGA